MQSDVLQWISRTDASLTVTQRNGVVTSSSVCVCVCVLYQCVCVLCQCVCVIVFLNHKSGVNTNLWFLIKGGWMKCICVTACVCVCVSLHLIAVCVHV